MYYMIIMATVKDLIFDSHNANKGTSRGRGMLEKSLSKYGAGRSILLDKNNRIIAGNKTVEVALKKMELRLKTELMNTG